MMTNEAQVQATAVIVSRRGGGWYPAVRMVLHNIALLISHYNENHIHVVFIGGQA
ncbi:predicted protein [Escherichia coli B088]|nr:predicted protein [Escherichia coli B088]